LAISSSGILKGFPAALGNSNQTSKMRPTTIGAEESETNLIAVMIFLNGAYLSVA
jgi:hypothetical protein